jgi:2-polyprenyl-6-methoxyphenol hydroxylase-like FAD-dependent oxidoreductase
MPASTGSTSCVALVAGAGPIGLTMALELSRHGVPSRVIDVAPRATDKSKALVVWGRTLELLDQSGDVTADFFPQGVLARAVNIFGNGRVATGFRSAAQTAPTAG